MVKDLGLRWTTRFLRSFSSPTSAGKSQKMQPSGLAERMYSRRQGAHRREAWTQSAPSSSALGRAEAPALRAGEGEGTFDLDRETVPRTFAFAIPSPPSPAFEHRLRSSPRLGIRTSAA